MTPSVSASPSAAAWKLAMAEIGAAERLLTDEKTDTVLEVARHLRRAWGHLYCDLHGVAEEASDEAVAELAARYYSPTFAGDELARDLVMKPDEAEGPGSASLREGLAREVAALRRAIDEMVSRRDGSAWAGLGLVFAVMTLLAFAPLLGDVTGTVTAPWRGRYYDNEKFEGEARERFDRKIEFDFGKDKPMRGIGKDHFSVRWDTCLTLDEETKVRFQLASDDGSKLFVDGEEVVENWGAHGTRTRYGNSTLEAGVHYLEVEYYEVRHGANVTLKASFDKESPDSIPVEMISPPSDDPKNPCG